ncbi:hypothetical protein R5R35_009698 [Gryllus longicercus]|uniref:Ras-related protein Rab n=1 Tax=Gryllus longicercus TaxID=2509291 RepID=A0AAN9VEE6_9ORTH
MSASLHVGAVSDGSVAPPPSPGMRHQQAAATSSTAPGSERARQPSAPPRELLFKFLVIGDYGVGKTAIVRRYTEGKFSSNYKITIGADFAIKSLQWDPGTKVNLQLWDIAGHERFGYMTRVYFKYAVAAAVVFDVSRIATFQSVQKWLTDLREKVSLQDGSPVPVVLLANKCDIAAASVPTDLVARFCRDNGLVAWYLTSAKENIAIDEAMACLVRQVLALRTSGPTHSDGLVLGANSSETLNHSSGCCGS